jgi:hypothetical protein
LVNPGSTTPELHQFHYVQGSLGTSCDTTAQVWATVHNTYASQSRACVIHLRMKLASTRKGDTPMTSYFTKMKEYTDEMAVAGKQLEDDDIVSYILA